MAEPVVVVAFLIVVARVGAAIALLEGRFEDAESLALEALKIGQRSMNRSALLEFAEQIFMLRGWQNRLDEVEPYLNQSAVQGEKVTSIRTRNIVRMNHLA